MPDVISFSTLDVLTRSGPDRDAFIIALDATVDTDAALVSDVLRVTGRISAAVATRGTLVELCALVRALDAWETGQIELEELAAGIEAHAARTEGFERFGSARIDLRTLAELLARVRAHVSHSEAALRAQISYLHASLRNWLLEELTGTRDGVLEPLPTEPRAELPGLVTDPVAHHAAHELAEELLAGAAWFDFRGLVAAAWRRGWTAVPRAGERMGEDRGELSRLVHELGKLDVTELVHVDLAPRARWRLAGARIELADGTRRVAVHELTPSGIADAIADRPAHALFSSADGVFAYLEGDDHHVVAGPREFVEAVCGASAGEALAAFREHVESRGHNGDDPPVELLHVADRYGRLRRRGRGGS